MIRNPIVDLIDRQKWIGRAADLIAPAVGQAFAAFGDRGRAVSEIRARLALLGLTDAGYHYEEVNQFLERMVSTTIKSEYAVYFHGTKKWAKDIFHVFGRVVLTGQELPDGTLAQMNYVYLSDWQLDNINSNYTFPIDFNSYRLLKRDIAQPGMPLGQNKRLAAVAQAVAIAL